MTNEEKYSVIESIVNCKTDKYTKPLDKLLCIEMFDRGWWSKEQVESLLTAWESQYKRYCEDAGY